MYSVLFKKNTIHIDIEMDTKEGGVDDAQGCAQPAFPVPELEAVTTD